MDQEQALAKGVGALRGTSLSYTLLTQILVLSLGAVCGELVILAEVALLGRLANRWQGTKLRRHVGLLFRLIAHLLLTLARLTGPGGVRAVAAESLAVKHQLLIMKRSRRRAPNLTGWDRLILGFCSLLVSPRRWAKIAVILKTYTLLHLHRALVKGKYHLLYGV